MAFLPSTVRFLIFQDPRYPRQKVSGSINFKLFTIFPTTYVRISLQTVSKVSTIVYVTVVPGT